jgi:flagellar basal-body rod protein FlgB
MMGTMVNYDSMQAARIALDGLSLRQQMISRNIANVDTPGYQAQNVSFEAAVKSALTKAEQPALTVTNVAHLQPTTSTAAAITVDRPGSTQRADGNDVDIDNELTQMNDTSLRYQALTEMVNLKFSLLKAISVSR